MTASQQSATVRELAPLLFAVYAELREKELDLDPPKVAFHGMNQLFVTDPAGYELCFQNEAAPAP